MKNDVGGIARNTGGMRRRAGSKRQRRGDDRQARVRGKSDGAQRGEVHGDGAKLRVRNGGISGRIADGGSDAGAGMGRSTEGKRKEVARRRYYGQTGEKNAAAGSGQASAQHTAGVRQALPAERSARRSKNSDTEPDRSGREKKRKRRRKEDNGKKTGPAMPEGPAAGWPKARKQRGRSALRARARAFHKNRLRSVLPPRRRL